MKISNIDARSKEISHSKDASESVSLFMLNRAKLLLLCFVFFIPLFSYSEDTSIQNFSHFAFKKGTCYSGFGFLPQNTSIHIDVNETHFGINNSASINVEYFLANRLSVLGYAALTHYYSTSKIDTTFSQTERRKLSSFNPLLGIGVAYYPKFFQINPKHSSILYNIGVFGVFNRSYVKGGFINSTNKIDISDASVNAGFIVQFYPKNRFHLPTSRFSGQLIYSIPTYYINRLESGFDINKPPYNPRFANSNFLTFGIKYQLSPLAKQVNKEIPEKFRITTFDQLYKEKSIHAGLGFNRRPVYYENNTSSTTINYMVINTDLEYFIKRRLSVNLGYIGLRSSNPTDVFDIQSSDRLSAFISVYPKFMRGLNRFSFSTSLGLSYFNGKVELLSEPNDLEYNFAFKTMQVFGAYTFIYKPLRLFKKVNHNFSLQLRSMGSVYTFQNLTKFREGDEKFEPFGSGIARGLLIRAVYKLN